MSQSAAGQAMLHLPQVPAFGAVNTSFTFQAAAPGEWVTSGLTHIWSRDLDALALGDVSLFLSLALAPTTGTSRCTLSAGSFTLWRRGLLMTCHGIFCVCEIRIISGAWESESVLTGCRKHTIAPRPICYAALFFWFVIMHAKIQREI